MIATNLNSIGQNSMALNEQKDNIEQNSDAIDE